MRSPKSAFQLFVAILAILAGACFLLAAMVAGSKSPNVITGKAALADYTQQKPGTFRKIKLADLPEPFASESVDIGPSEAARTADGLPQTIQVFEVALIGHTLLLS